MNTTVFPFKKKSFFRSAPSLTILSEISHASPLTMHKTLVRFFKFKISVELLESATRVSDSFDIASQHREKINSANYVCADKRAHRGQLPRYCTRLGAFNDTERRLRGITVGYSSSRVTFQTSHERSRDIPQGPGTFVPIWRHIIPESGQTVRPFPRSALFVVDFACSPLPATY